MIDGFNKWSSRPAVVTAAGLFAAGLALTPAEAADLGGDCCADLEERVAELEATTVRKGNSKVSLTVSGQVNRELLFWDNGVDDDVYIVDSNLSSTRLRFSGSARINSSLEAGFKIEFDPEIDTSDEVDETTGTSALNIDMRIHDVWLKGTVGKLSLGKGDTASNGASEVDISGSGIVGYSSGFPDHMTSFTFQGGGGPTVGDAFSNFDGLSRRSRLRYDTPTFAGFTVSTSWGQTARQGDDFWDVALRYAGEFGGIRVAAAVAVTRDEDSTGAADDETEGVNGSISVMHVPTGLNVTFAAGNRDFASTTEDGDFHYVKVGIKQKWFAVGATAISVDYYHGDDINTAFVGNDDSEFWGVQFVQNIDAAAMEIYAGYYHAEYDETGSTFEDMDMFAIGSRIKF